MRPAYDQISAGVIAASRNNHVEQVITAGFSAPWCGNLIVRAAGAFRIRFPNAVVEIEEIQLADPLGRMRSGAVDLQLTEFPIAEPDISTGSIMFSEPRGLMVPQAHPFAVRESVSMEELADTTLVTIADELVPRYWMDHYFPRQTPSGRPIPQGPATKFLAEMLVHVSQGVGVGTVALRAEGFHARPHLAFVPVHDAPSIDYGLMWPTAGKNPLVQPFLKVIAEAAVSQ